MLVRTVLARLKERPSDIRKALDGSVLSLSMMVTDRQPEAYSVVFSPDGHVSVFTPDDVPTGFRPHVRLRGTRDQVLGVVLGETDAFTAALKDVLDLSVKPSELTPQYPRVMQLVREEVWRLLDAD